MKHFVRICAFILALCLLGGCVAHMTDKPLVTPDPTSAPAPTAPPAEPPTAAPSVTAAPIIDADPTVFSEFSEINLTEAMGQGFITRVFVCENGTLAVISHVDGLALLGAYDPVRGEVLFTGTELGYTDITGAGFDGENYFATFYDTSGDEITTVSPDGELLGGAYYELGARYLPLSDTLTLREYMGDISVLGENGETLLLDSVDAAAASEDLNRYQICFVIDERRFAYVKYGWEWIADAGICDAAIGETMSIGGGLLPIAYRDGLLYLMRSEIDEPAALYSLDTVTGELNELIVPANEQDVLYLPTDAEHIFYLTPNFKGEGSAELRVYSRAGELLETHIIICGGSTVQYADSLGGGNLIVYGEAYYGRDFFIYTLTE